MNLRTPLVGSLAVLSALGGVAIAAIALPTSPPKAAAALVQATATPEVRTETVRRTIHVARREKATPTPTAAPAASRSSSSSSSDDSGHHRSGTDDSRHRGGGDSGHRRGRGRGGDD